MRPTVLALCSVVSAHNSSELLGNPSNNLLGYFDPKWLFDPNRLANENSFLDASILDISPWLSFAPSLVQRAVQPTPLPASGVAASMGPNETHVYYLNMTSTKLNFSVSLSECVRSPLEEEPLKFRSGDYRDSTHDGGLLQIGNLSLLNGTFEITSPDTTNLQAHWSYQLGYDLTASYGNDHEGLYWVDSDFANSLFVTESYENFSRLLFNTPFAHFVNHSDLNSTTRGFNLFLHNVNGSAPSPPFNVDDPNAPDSHHNSIVDILGKSYCAMQQSALLNQNNAVYSTTDRSNNRSAHIFKGQFLFHGLNTSSQYMMQLAVPPPAGSTLGGMIFEPVPFRTKDSMSCQLIYDMPMCPNTAFSVPGNASMFTADELTGIYNDYVERYYNNFTQALAQINCNASRQDMFSVFSNCDDCDTAYRNWLCTVAVPRCEDWSNDSPYLVERRENESRNEMINNVLRPGKYKEILPCYWLCDNLVTYCPLSMGFACPDSRMINSSYGWNVDNGDVSCSYPGAVYRPDGAWLSRPSWVLLVVMAFLVCSI